VCKCHVRRDEIVILVGLEEGLDIFFSEVHCSGHETIGNEFNRLNHAPLDDVIVVVHAERNRLAIQSLFPQVVIDQALEFPFL
jgi:hypothetical protein